MISRTWKFTWWLIYFGVWSWSSCTSSCCRICLTTHSCLFIDPVFFQRSPCIIDALLVHSCSLCEGLRFLSDRIGCATLNVTCSAFCQHFTCFFINVWGEFGQSNCSLKLLLDKSRNESYEILNPFDVTMSAKEMALIGIRIWFSNDNSALQ